MIRLPFDTKSRMHLDQHYGIFSKRLNQNRILVAVEPSAKKKAFNLWGHLVARVPFLYPAWVAQAKPGQLTCPKKS